MTTCNHKSVPADPHTCLTKDMSPSSQEQKEKMIAIPYREAVGALLYAAITFQPDIAYALNQTASFVEIPGPAHWNAVKQILAYLKGTVNFGIVFTGSVEKLNAFSDADFGRCIDSRKSISGSFLRLNGPVTWGSKRKSCVATSTTQAEYIAAFETTKDAVWMRNLLNEIGVKQTEPTPLFCDNQSTIKLTSNPEFHKRTKHFDIKYHYIREQQEARLIETTYLDTNRQLADLFTKPLRTPRFEELRASIGMKEVK